LDTLSEVLPEVVQGNPDFQVIGVLRHRQAEEILNCLFASQGNDITRHQEVLLKPALDLQRLKDHFDRKK
jgi:hypothetical protein